MHTGVNSRYQRAEEARFFGCSDIPVNSPAVCANQAGCSSGSRPHSTHRPGVRYYDCRMPGIRTLLLAMTLGLFLTGCGLSEGNEPDPKSSDPAEPDVPDEPGDDEGNEAEEHSPAIAVALLAEVNSTRTSGVSCGGDWWEPAPALTAATLGNACIWRGTSGVPGRRTLLTTNPRLK